MSHKETEDLLNLNREIVAQLSRLISSVKELTSVIRLANDLPEISKKDRRWLNEARKFQ